MARRILGVLLAALALWGCPDKNKPTRETNTLRIHVEAEPAHLVSMLQPDAWAHRITSHNLFESLVRLHPRSYEVQGELASTWKVSDDKLTYTFYLRDGVRWHDGKPFTGADVTFTLDRLLDPAVRAASARASLQPFIDSYRLVEDNVLEITCKRPSRWFLVSIADLAILPRHVMRKGDLNKHPALRRPVGTGPYRFAGWKSGRSITLERFPGYWGEKPRIRRLVYRIVRDADVALKLARRRELDFVPRVRAAQWRGQVLKDPLFRHEFIVTYHDSPGTTYIVLNHKRALFQDVRVRRALGMLLDRDTIADKILRGLARKIDALYWFKDPDYNEDVEPIPFAPARARKLLAAAGWRDSDDNGVLDREGRPFKFTFLLPATSKSARRWLTLYQQQLKRAGVVMDINPLDWSAYLGRIRAHEFDAGALGMVQVGPFTDLYYQFHSSQADGGQNYGAYSNTEVDGLLERIRSEMDPARRRRQSLRVQRLLARDVAVIPLFSYKDPGIVSRHVHGVYDSALWYQVRDWWKD